MMYRTRMSEMVGDPGLFSGIARAVGSVARIVGGTVGRVIPGVGAVASVVGAAAGRLSRQAAPSMVVPSFAGQVPAVPGARVQRGPARAGVSARGTLGVTVRYGRRMNAGNAKAARRAIRRIKAVRHLLQSIERELPRRPAARSCTPFKRRARR